MKNLLSILKFSICAVCCGFLLLSCKSTPEAIVPAKHIVEIKAMKFQPAEHIVKSGDTVVWVNRDIVAHDVTEDPGKAWTSSVMPAGASWRFVVTKKRGLLLQYSRSNEGKIISAITFLRLSGVRFINYKNEVYEKDCN